MTESALDSLLRRRRMVRNYQERCPERSLVEAVLDRARRAPSAGFTQAVSFVVVSAASTRSAIAKLADESSYVERGFPAWLSRAPIHVIPVVEEEAYHRRYAAPDKRAARSSREWEVPYWFVDAGASLMLLLLAAPDAGLAAGFQGSHNLPGLGELLGLPPGVLPLGVVTLGYAAEDRPSGSLLRGRKALDQLVHWEHW